MITSDLQNITGLLNQPISLECQAKGFPKVETKWSRVMQEGRRGRQPLPIRKFRERDFLIKITFFKPLSETKEYRSKRLEFNLTRENAGQYTCSSWNANGRAEKSIHVDFYGEYLLHRGLTGKM